MSPPSTNSESRRHELLSGVAESTALRLIRKHGLAPEAAADVGNDLADYLVENWKRQHIYLPAEDAFKLNARDMEIYRRLERGNAQELAKEFNISYVRVYQINRRVKAEMLKRNQPSLPGFDSE
jgi:Mor family transcriptional regulator